MRAPAAALAFAALAAVASSPWALGCTDLVSDCELEVNCKPVAPPPVCSDILQPGDCDSCAEASCCQELEDCDADPYCYGACYYGFWPPNAACASAPTKDLLAKLLACLKTSCTPACNPHDKCHPVTDSGCNPTLQDCDAITPGVFECITPLGTAAKLCEICDIHTGPACGPGMRCFAGSKQCARYCCADADCGTGKCVTDQVPVFGAPLLNTNVIGICLTPDAKTPACDAPAISPSKGACFTTYPAN